MPEKSTLRRARRDRKQGKAATTQAGEFVKEEMDHVKRGKHGVKSRKQAIAIGLSKARKSGVKIPARGKAASSKKRRTTSAKKSTASRSRRSTATKKTARKATPKSRRTSTRRSSTRRSSSRR